MPSIPSLSVLRMTIGRLSAIAVASAVAVTAAALYWRFGGQKVTKRRGRLRGLFNLGNTCYMNSLLQAWASSPSIRSWLQKVQPQSEAERLSPSRKSQVFLTAARDLLESLNEFDSETVSAESVLDALLAHRWAIGVGDEQDCYELMNVFLSVVDDELSSSWTNRSLLDIVAVADNAEDGAASPKDHRPLLEAIRRFLADRQAMRPPFQGLIATKLQCTNCGQKAFPLRLEYCLRRYFRGELLRELVCESCGGRSAQTASASTMSKGDFVKRQGFSKLPDSLIVQLQRTGWLPTGASFKYDDFIAFPEVLDLRDFVFYRQRSADDLPAFGEVSQARLAGGHFANSQSSVGEALPSTSVQTTKEKLHTRVSVSSALSSVSTADGVADPSRALRDHNMASVQMQSVAPAETASTASRSTDSVQLAADLRYRYRLSAVIVHIGGRFDSGHFVTYRRASGANGGADSCWYYTSDADVHRVSLEEVLSSQAYMLFYERVVLRKQLS